MPRRPPPIPSASFAGFVRVVRRLRKECPWDRKQTHLSLRQALIEEAYETVEGIDRGDWDELRGELGDLLLHIVLHARIAEEKGEFTLRDVIEGITAKMIRRHPHVFGTVRARNADEVKRNWERIKMAEGRVSLLEGIPKQMPALQRAHRMQSRAAKVGFDWEKPEQVWEKVREELEELRRTLHGGARRKREEEFGDLLFALVNYARFLRIDPETALRQSNLKFAARFRYIEQALAKLGRHPHDATLAEMDALWNEAKRKRKPARRRAR
jgi:MazG family protein